MRDDLESDTSDDESHQNLTYDPNQHDHVSQGLMQRRYSEPLKEPESKFVRDDLSSSDFSIRNEQSSDDSDNNENDVPESQ